MTEKAALFQFIKRVETISGRKIIKESAEYGDIIGVHRTLYKHFGVYINDQLIIHYAPPNGDIGQDAYNHETTLNKFLGGASSYFVGFQQHMENQEK